MAERWHVGREIPLALIITILCSVGSGIWYASATNARVTVIEKTLETQVTLREDIVQIREQLKNLDRLTQRIETLLDRRSDASKSDKSTTIGKDIQ